MNVIECLLNFTFLGLHRSRPVESVIIGLCAVVMTRALLLKSLALWDARLTRVCGRSSLQDSVVLGQRVFFRLLLHWT